MKLFYAIQQFVGSIVLLVGAIHGDTNTIMIGGFVYLAGILNYSL